MTVSVVGNATVDLSYEVEHLPTPGETVLAAGKLTDAGGKGLNQAVVARRAGAAVRLTAVVGDDAAAAFISGRLDAEGLDAGDLHRWEGPTDESLILVARGGENSVVSTAGAARSLAPERAVAALDSLGPGDLLLMQGNLSRETTAACLEGARRRQVATVLNPAPVAFAYDGLWALVDVAVLNEVEAELLGGSAEPAEAAARLREAGAGCVIVTLGAAGALLAGAEGLARVSAPPVDAVDTTGAGDVVCGVIAAGLAAGLGAEAALAWAVAAASLACTRRGTSASFPSAAELARLRGGVPA